MRGSALNLDSALLLVRDASQLLAAEPSVGAFCARVAQALRREGGYEQVRVYARELIAVDPPGPPPNEPLASLVTPITCGDRPCGAIECFGAAGPDRDGERSLSAALAAMIGVLLARRARTEGAVAELRESEERFQTLAECLPDALYVLDPEDPEVPTRILYANRAACELDGYAADDLLGRSLTELLDAPQSAALAGQRVQQISRSDVTCFEVVHRHRLGHLIPLEVRALRITWCGREAILAIDRDLRERRHREAAAAEVSWRLNLALACGELGIWDWDVRGDALVWDVQHARLFGTTLEAFEGNGAAVQRMVHPDDIPPLHAQLQRALARGEVFRYEFRVILPAGGTRWISGCGQVLLDDEGRAVRAVGVSQDVTARREAEEALRARNHLFALITGAMRDSIGLVAFDGRVVYVSPSIEQTLGYHPDELVGRNGVDVLLPESRATGRELLAAAAAGREIRHEGVARHKDGHLVALESVLTLSRDDTGVARGIVFCTREVGERRRAEIALREAHRRYEDLVSSVDGIVWEADAATLRFTFVSRAAERLLGFPAERWLDPGFWEAQIHPEDRDATVRYYLCSAQGCRDHQFEYRMIGRDGRAVWLRDVVTVVKGERGPLLRGIMVDVSERRLIEARERLFRERFELAAASAQLGVWDYDVVTDRVEWDDRMSAIYGLGPGHCPDDRAAWERLIHPDDLPRLRVLARERTTSVEFRVVRPSGELRHLRSFAKQVFDASGALVRLTGVSLDISEQTRAEEQQREIQQRLQRALKLEAIGRLAGGVAHDFNNLLQVISLSADQLAEGAEREASDAIRDACARGSELTRQLLAFGRKQILKVEVLDLGAAIVDTARLLRRLLGADIAVDLRLRPNLPAIRADLTQLHQILINLAANARDAMPEGGVLQIEADVTDQPGPSPRFPEVSAGTYVRLRVSDTGGGMDESTRTMIFEPFFTTKAPGKGTGLGLATVYGIVRQLAGHVAVDSELGHGATFTFLFPAVPSARAEAARGPPTEQARGTETILVVEDEPGVRRLTTRLLTARGFHVLAAADVGEALRLFERWGAPINLLLTDVVMPDGSGTQLAQTLRTRSPRLKVIYMSGYNDDTLLRRGVEHGSTPFLQKPFTADALARCVRETLDAG